MEKRRSEFTQISFEKYNPVKKAYRFQEVCAELSKLSGLKFGTCLALWKKRGNDIERILSEIKQGEIKKPAVYIKYLLKK